MESQADSASAVLLFEATELLAGDNFQESINKCSEALRGSLPPEERVQLLLLRSDGLARLSRYIRSKNALDSEISPIFGSDPLHYASMAAKDAKEAHELKPDSAEALLHLASASFLLEEYPKARAEFQAGLAIQPADARLQDGLAAVEAVLADSPAAAGQAGAKRSAREVAWDDAMECTLCMEMLYEPVTTPCGHTFCQNCFARAMDHHNRCPMCRVVLHVGRKLPVTVALRSILKRSFPEQYEARQADVEKAQKVEEDGPLPLFVMSALLPGETVGLNIFEPRYRLMIRRCMDGNRIFGMAQSSHGSVAPVACQAEIVECESLPDGRYGIEIVGRRRFRIARTWDQDGYRMAQPEYFDDEPLEAGSEEAAKLAALARRTKELGTEFLAKLRSHSRVNPQVLQLIARAGELPEDAGPEAVSFWAAGLCGVLGQSDKLRMLQDTNTKERLELVEARLKTISEKELGACIVM